jgi:hypothetical protein
MDLVDSIRLLRILRRGTRSARRTPAERRAHEGRWNGRELQPGRAQARYRSQLRRRP